MFRRHMTHGFPDWDETKAMLNEWTAQYPNLVQQKNIGKTYEGRDIPCYVHRVAGLSVLNSRFSNASHLSPL